MHLRTLLFGLQGRINRAQYWLATLVALGLLAVCLLIAVAVSGERIDDSPASQAVLLIGVSVLGWISLATAAKRLHDHNKGPWWLMLFFVVPVLLDTAASLIGNDGAGLVLGGVSLAIGLWAFVKLGCMKGTDGPNDYGPDPLASPPITRV